MKPIQKPPRGCDLPRGPEGTQVKLGDRRHKRPELPHQHGQGGADRLRLVDQQRGVGRPRALRRSMEIAGVMEGVQQPVSLRRGEKHLARRKNADMADVYGDGRKLRRGLLQQSGGFLLFRQGEGGQADMVGQSRRLRACEARFPQREIPLAHAPLRFRVQVRHQGQKLLGHPFSLLLLHYTQSARRCPPLRGG